MRHQMICDVHSNHAKGKMRNENGTLKIVRSCVSLRASVKVAFEFLFAYTLSLAAIRRVFLLRRVDLLTMFNDRMFRGTSKIAFCVRRKGTSLPSQPSADVLFLVGKTRYASGGTGTERHTFGCRER